MSLTPPLWCLLGFAGWTLALLLSVGAVRVSQILLGRKQANDFPGDVPHGSDAYRRLMRAHQNCVENLPLFAVVVLTAAVSEVRTGVIDLGAQVLLAARIGQSLAHVASGSNFAVSVRFTFFVAQIASLVAMAVSLARAA